MQAPYFWVFLRDKQTASLMKKSGGLLTGLAVKKSDSEFCMHIAVNLKTFGGSCVDITGRSEAFGYLL